MVTKSSAKTGRGSATDPHGEGASSGEFSGARGGLATYRQKRDPAVTNEPFAAERIARGEKTASGAFVVHCHAGKDRTGIVAALLLGLAGVPPAAIGEDYALSGERLRPRHEEWFASAQDDAERARIERIAATPAQAMQAVVEQIRERSGGVEAYLRDAGLDAGVIAAARARLR